MNNRRFSLLTRAPIVVGCHQETRQAYALRGMLKFGGFLFFVEGMARP